MAPVVHGTGGAGGTKAPRSVLEPRGGGSGLLCKLALFLTRILFISLPCYHCQARHIIARFWLGAFFLLLSLCDVASNNHMSYLDVPSFKLPKELGLGATDAALYAASVQLRATLPASPNVAAAETAAAARPRRTFRPENEEQRENRLGGGPQVASPEQSSGPADYHGVDDFGNAGPGDDDIGGALAGPGGTAGFGRAANTRPPGTGGPPESTYVTQHNRFVDEAPLARVAMTAAHDADLSARQSGYRHSFGQRKAMIDDAWMKHNCCVAACSQARLRGTDAVGMAAIKAKFVTIKDSAADCVIVQVNSFFHAELQRLVSFTCNICGAKDLHASAVDYGCTQGSHDLAAHGTTQVFTNEFLDSVFPMWRRGLSFKCTLPAPPASCPPSSLPGNCVLCMCGFSHSLFLDFRSSRQRHGQQLPVFRVHQRPFLAGTGPRVRKKPDVRVPLARPLPVNDT